MASSATEISPTFYLEAKPPADDGDWEGYESLLVTLTEWSEKAERYDDMCRFMTEVVESKFSRKAELIETERNLLSVAFKNVVGVLRSAWRTFNKGVESEREPTEQELADKYSQIVEKQLENKCLEVLGILENKLIPTCKDEGEAKVFYLKMSGDYYRYLAEFRDTQENKNGALRHYEAALEAAKKNLPETHPTRLGLALNFSVCYFEILKEPRKACNLAKSAFDEAIQKLDTLNDSNYKDSTLIMQLLRDNLTLWTSEGTEENED